jgi:hypothetical protein
MEDQWKIRIFLAHAAMIDRELLSWPGLSLSEARRLRESKLDVIAHLLDAVRELKESNPEALTPRSRINFADMLGRVGVEYIVKCCNGEVGYHRRFELALHAATEQLTEQEGVVFAQSRSAAQERFSLQGDECESFMMLK